MNQDFNDLLISLDKLEIKEHAKKIRENEVLDLEHQRSVEKQRSLFIFDENDLFEQFKQKLWVYRLLDTSKRHIFGDRPLEAIYFRDVINLRPLEFTFVTKDQIQSYFNRCADYLRSTPFNPKQEPFSFSLPAAPIIDRLKYVTSQEPDGVVYITLEEQVSLFNLYREVLISSMYYLLGLSKDNYLATVLPHILNIFSVKHAVAEKILIRFFKRISDDLDENLVLLCRKWYLDNECTFVHRPSTPNFEIYSPCVYLLSEEQRDELSIYFYFKIESDITQLKKKRVPAHTPFDGKTEKTIERLKIMIMEIKQWQHIK